MVIHADAGGFAAEATADPAAAAHLPDGASLAVTTLRRLACDCRWQLIVEHPDATPAGIGRTSRQIPPWLSRALRRRDGQCRFPGCDRTRWTHGHHITHWIDGVQVASHAVTITGGMQLYASDYNVGGGTVTVRPSWRQPFHSLQEKNQFSGGGWVEPVRKAAIIR